MQRLNHLEIRLHGKIKDMARTGRIALVLIFIFFSGCVAANIQTIPVPNKEERGSIAVYRKEALNNAGDKMIIGLDGIEFAKLSNND